MHNDSVRSVSVISNNLFNFPGLCVYLYISMYIICCFGITNKCTAVIQCYVPELYLRTVDDSHVTDYFCVVVNLHSRTCSNV